MKEMNKGFVFTGKQFLRKIKDKALYDFMIANQNNAKIIYTIVSIYKGVYDNESYVNGVLVEGPGITSMMYYLQSGQWISMTDWRCLFTDKDTYIHVPDVINKQYVLRKISETNRYRISYRIVSSLFQRNSLTKMATHGLTKSDDQKAVVTPLKVVNGVITKLYVRLPNEYCGRVFEFKQIRKAPSLKMFLNVFKEHLEVEKTGPYITQSQSDELINLVDNYLNQVSSSGTFTGWAAREKRAELKLYLKRLVK